MSATSIDATDATTALPNEGVGSKQSNLRYAWFVAGMLSLAYLLSLVDRYILGVTLEAVKADLHLNDTQLGILQGPSFVFLYVAASIPLGWLVDITNRRIIIAAGLTIWSIATAACGFADTYAHILTARLTVGLGEAALLPSAMSLLASYFTRDKLNRAISIYSMGGSFGRATAFIGGGILLAWFTAKGTVLIGGLVFEPWQAVFLTAGLAGLVFTVVFLLTVREPARSGTTAKRVRFVDGWAFFWRHRWAYLSVIMPFTMIAGIGALLASWAMSFYLRAHGIPVAVASTFIGITGLIAGTIGNLAGGWLADFAQARGVKGVQPLVLGILLLVIALFAGPYALATSSTVSLVCYGAAYFAMCIGGPIGHGGVQLPTPERFRGSLASICLVITSALGTALLPLSVGLFTDYIFEDARQLGLAIFTTILLSAIVGLPFAIFGRRKYIELVARNEQAHPPI